MSEYNKERLNAEFQKAKEEGRMRIERIQGIVQEAFSQTLAEVKDGSGEIRAIVKETLSETLDVANETGEERTETVQKTPSTSSKSLILAIFKAIKSRLFVYLHQEYTTLPAQYAKLKNQAVNLDTNLTERYGDRYVAVKQRLEKGAAWYKDVTAQAKTMEPNVLQQQQAEVVNKLGEAGATVARKERHIKQQLKELLKTAAAQL
jgi:hypothetical protein